MIDNDNNEENFSDASWKCMWLNLIVAAMFYFNQVVH